jgi:hypothetical protein
MKEKPKSKTRVRLPLMFRVFNVMQDFLAGVLVLVACLKEDIVIPPTLNVFVMMFILQR